MTRETSQVDLRRAGGHVATSSFDAKPGQFATGPNAACLPTRGGLLGEAMRAAGERSWDLRNMIRPLLRADRGMAVAWLVRRSR